MILQIQLHHQFVVFAGVIPKSVGIYKLFNSKREKKVNLATSRKKILELHNQVCNCKILHIILCCRSKLIKMLKKKKLFIRAR